MSREGDLWRWDGFVAAAGGVTPAAQRFAHKNRLLELDRRAQAVLNEAKDTIDAERAAADAFQKAEAEERRLRQLWRERQNELAQVRQQLTSLEKLQRESETRLAGVSAQRSRADEDLTNAQARHVEIEAHIVHDERRARISNRCSKAAQSRRRTSTARLSHWRKSASAASSATGKSEPSASGTSWPISPAGKADRPAPSSRLVPSTRGSAKRAVEMDANADLPDRIAAQRQALLSAAVACR